MNGVWRRGPDRSKRPGGNNSSQGEKNLHSRRGKNIALIFKLLPAIYPRFVTTCEAAVPASPEPKSQAIKTDKDES